MKQILFLHREKYKNMTLIMIKNFRLFKTSLRILTIKTKLPNSLLITLKNILTVLKINLVKILIKEFILTTFVSTQKVTI